MELSAPAFNPPARPEFLRDRRPSVPVHRRPALAERHTPPVAAAVARALPIAPAVVVESRGVSTHFGAGSGVVSALPIMIGYFPVAFALGIMAATLKLSFIATALMSLIVYAGSSQFVALSLLGAGASGWTIVLTTFVVNFRHFLMSLSLSRHLSSWPRSRRVLLGLQLTDETFALLQSQAARKDPGEAHCFAVTNLAHASWFLGTIVGYWVSWLLPDTKQFGLDFAMCGMFIAMIVLQAANRMMVLAGLSAAAIAITLKAAGFGPGAVLFAAILGAGIGMGMEKWNSRSS
jgi:4-azaleucine resistance transporter AzlC